MLENDSFCFYIKLWIQRTIFFLQYSKTEKILLHVSRYNWYNKTWKSFTQTFCFVRAILFISTILGSIWVLMIFGILLEENIVKIAALLQKFLKHYDKNYVFFFRVVSVRCGRKISKKKILGLRYDVAGYWSHDEK